MQLRRLDERTLVAGQIGPDDVPALAAEGVAMIVNNRPDHEEWAQPTAAEVEVAAREAGIAYRHIPVAGGIPADAVEKLAEALGECDGQLLLFCRSGTRSTFLWALAMAARGADGADLFAKAAAAGYDLAPIKAFLDRR